MRAGAWSALDSTLLYLHVHVRMFMYVRTYGNYAARGGRNRYRIRYATGSVQSRAQPVAGGNVTRFWIQVQTVL